MDRDKRATLRFAFAAIGAVLAIVVVFVFGFVGPGTELFIPDHITSAREIRVVETPLDFGDFRWVFYAAIVGSLIGYAIGGAVAEEIYK